MPSRYDPNCPACKGSGLRDSGGTYPWGEPIDVPCDCLTPPAPDDLLDWLRAALVDLSDAARKANIPGGPDVLLIAALAEADAAIHACKCRNEKLTPNRSA